MPRPSYWSSRPMRAKTHQETKRRYPTVCREYPRKEIQSHQSREYSCLHEGYLRDLWQ